MENDNGNNSKNTIIGVLIVLVIALGAYIGYDKFLSKDKLEVSGTQNSNSNSDNNVDTNQNSGDYYDNLRNNLTTTYIDSSSKLQLLLDKKGNIYYNTDSSWKMHTSENKSNYEIEDLPSYDGNKVFSGYKLNIAGVILVYSTDIGNGGDHCYIFVKGDGSIGILVWYEDTSNNEIIFRNFNSNVSGLSNIVSFAKRDPIGARGGVLVDINGNTYDLSNYVK